MKNLRVVFSFLLAVLMVVNNGSGVLAAISTAGQSYLDQHPSLGSTTTTTTTTTNGGTTTDGGGTTNGGGETTDPKGTDAACGPLDGKTVSYDTYFGVNDYMKCAVGSFGSEKTTISQNGNGYTWDCINGFSIRSCRVTIVGEVGGTWTVDKNGNLVSSTSTPEPSCSSLSTTTPQPYSYVEDLAFRHGSIWKTQATAPVFCNPDNSALDNSGRNDNGYDSFLDGGPFYHGLRMVKDTSGKKTAMVWSCGGKACGISIAPSTSSTTTITGSCNSGVYNSVTTIEQFEALKNNPNTQWCNPADATPERMNTGAFSDNNGGMLNWSYYCKDKNGKQVSPACFKNIQVPTCHSLGINGYLDSRAWDEIKNRPDLLCTNGGTPVFTPTTNGSVYIGGGITPAPNGWSWNCEDSKGNVYGGACNIQLGTPPNFTPPCSGAYYSVLNGGYTGGSVSQADYDITKNGILSGDKIIWTVNVNIIGIPNTGLSFSETSTLSGFKVITKPSNFTQNGSTFSSNALVNNGKYSFVFESDATPGTTVQNCVQKSPKVEMKANGSLNSLEVNNCIETKISFDPVCSSVVVPPEPKCGINNMEFTSLQDFKDYKRGRRGGAFIANPPEYCDPTDAMTGYVENENGVSWKCGNQQCGITITPPDCGLLPKGPITEAAFNILRNSTFTQWCSPISVQMKDPVATLDINTFPGGLGFNPQPGYVWYCGEKLCKIATDTPKELIGCNTDLPKETTRLEYLKMVMEVGGPTQRCDPASESAKDRQLLLNPLNGTAIGESRYCGTQKCEMKWTDNGKITATKSVNSTGAKPGEPLDWKLVFTAEGGNSRSKSFSDNIPSDLIVEGRDVEPTSCKVTIKQTINSDGSTKVMTTFDEGMIDGEQCRVIIHTKVSDNPKSDSIQNCVDEVVNGVCKAYNYCPATQPSTMVKENYCLEGNMVNLREDPSMPGGLIWECEGENGGATVTSCNMQCGSLNNEGENITPTLKSGVCGSSAGKSFSSRDKATQLCAEGSVSYSDETPAGWRRYCATESDEAQLGAMGRGVECFASKPVVCDPIRDPSCLQVAPVDNDLATATVAPANKGLLTLPGIVTLFDILPLPKSNCVEIPILDDDPVCPDEQKLADGSCCELPLVPNMDKTACVDVPEEQCTNGATNYPTCCDEGSNYLDLDGVICEPNGGGSDGLQCLYPDLPNPLTSAAFEAIKADPSYKWCNPDIATVEFHNEEDSVTWTCSMDGAENSTCSKTFVNVKLKCQIPGKEHLDADDPDCKEDIVNSGTCLSVQAQSPMTQEEYDAWRNAVPAPVLCDPASEMATWETTSTGWKWYCGDNSGSSCAITKTGHDSAEPCPTGQERQPDGSCKPTSPDDDCGHTDPRRSIIENQCCPAGQLPDAQGSCKPFTPPKGGDIKRGKREASKSGNIITRELYFSTTADEKTGVVFVDDLPDTMTGFTVFPTPPAIELPEGLTYKFSGNQLIFTFDRVTKVQEFHISVSGEIVTGNVATAINNCLGLEGVFLSGDESDDKRFGELVKLVGVHMEDATDNDRNDAEFCFVGQSGSVIYSDNIIQVLHGGILDVEIQRAAAYTHDYQIIVRRSDGTTGAIYSGNTFGDTTRPSNLGHYIPAWGQEHWFDYVRITVQTGDMIEVNFPSFRYGKVDLLNGSLGGFIGHSTQPVHFRFPLGSKIQPLQGVCRNLMAKPSCASSSGEFICPPDRIIPAGGCCSINTSRNENSQQCEDQSTGTGSGELIYEKIAPAELNGLTVTWTLNFRAVSGDIYDYTFVDSLEDIRLRNASSSYEGFIYKFEERKAYINIPHLASGDSLTVQVMTFVNVEDLQDGEEIMNCIEPVTSQPEPVKALCENISDIKVGNISMKACNAGAKYLYDTGLFYNSTTAQTACPDGYHLPNIAERSGVISQLATWNGGMFVGADQLYKSLYLPYSNVAEGHIGHYRSTSEMGVRTNFPESDNMISLANYFTNSSQGGLVRCFADHGSAGERETFSYSCGFACLNNPAGTVINSQKLSSENEALCPEEDPKCVTNNRIPPMECFTPITATYNPVDDNGECTFKCQNPDYVWNGNACVVKVVASCVAQPNYQYADFITGTPTSVDQARVKGASSCGFSCKSGWTGAVCDQAVAPTYSCQGNVPDNNATICPNDDQGLTVNENRRLFDNCTNGTKCKYVCNAGYQRDLATNKCVPVGVCGSANFQEISSAPSGTAKCAQGTPSASTSYAVGWWIFNDPRGTLRQKYTGISSVNPTDGGYMATRAGREWTCGSTKCIAVNIEPVKQAGVCGSANGKILGTMGGPNNPNGNPTAYYKLTNNSTTNYFDRNQGGILDACATGAKGSIGLKRNSNVMNYGDSTEWTCLGIKGGASVSCEAGNNQTYCRNKQQKFNTTTHLCESCGANQEYNSSTHDCDTVFPGEIVFNGQVESAGVSLSLTYVPDDEKIGGQQEEYYITFMNTTTQPVTISSLQNTVPANSRVTSADYEHSYGHTNKNNILSWSDIPLPAGKSDYIRVVVDQMRTTDNEVCMTINGDKKCTTLAPRGTTTSVASPIATPIPTPVDPQGEAVVISNPSSNTATYNKANPTDTKSCAYITKCSEGKVRNKETKKCESRDGLFIEKKLYESNLETRNVSWIIKIYAKENINLNGLLLSDKMVYNGLTYVDYKTTDPSKILSFDGMDPKYPVRYLTGLLKAGESFEIIVRTKLDDGVNLGNVEQCAVIYGASESISSCVCPDGKMRNEEIHGCEWTRKGNLSYDKTVRPSNIQRIGDKVVWTLTRTNNGYDEFFDKTFVDQISSDFTVNEISAHFSDGKLGYDSWFNNTDIMKGITRFEAYGSDYRVLGVNNKLFGINLTSPDTFEFYIGKLMKGQSFIVEIYATLNQTPWGDEPFHNNCISEMEYLSEGLTTVGQVCAKVDFPYCVVGYERDRKEQGCRPIHGTAGTLEYTKIADKNSVSNIGEEITWTVKWTAKGGNTTGKNFVDDVSTGLEVINVINNGVTNSKIEDATGTHITFVVPNLSSGQNVSAQIITKVKTAPGLGNDIMNCVNPATTSTIPYPPTTSEEMQEDVVTPNTNIDIPPQQTIASCETTPITVGAYQIASCNVGANAVGEKGSLFQWGRNQPFPAEGPIQTTTDKPSSVMRPYVGSSQFITITSPFTSISQLDWVQTRNDDLWGDVTNTDLARRGPCPDGWHVPSSGERRGFVKAWADNKGVAYTDYGDGNISPIIYYNPQKNNFLSDLKLITTWRDDLGNVVNSERVYNFSYVTPTPRLWSSTPYYENGPDSRFISILVADSGSVSYHSVSERTNGLSVRCFKNEASLGGEVVYNGEAGTDTKIGFTFEDWKDFGGAGDFDDISFCMQGGLSYDSNAKEIVAETSGIWQVNLQRAAASRHDVKITIKDSSGNIKNTIMKNTKGTLISSLSQEKATQSFDIPVSQGDRITFDVMTGYGGTFVEEGEAYTDGWFMSPRWRLVPNGQCASIISQPIVKFEPVVIPQSTPKNCAIVKNDIDKEGKIWTKKSFLNPAVLASGVELGDLIGYKIEFGNDSAVDLVNVEIKELLPKTLTFKSSELYLAGVKQINIIPENYSTNGKIWKGLKVAKGQSGYIILTGEVIGTDPTKTTNMACFHTQTGSDCASTGFQYKNVLTIDKKLETLGTISSGDKVEYSITIANPSKNSQTYFNVYDTLPSGMKFLSEDRRNDFESFEVNNGNPVKWGQFKKDLSIQPGGKFIIKYDVEITTTGTLVNTACVLPQNTPDIQKVCDSVSVTVALEEPMGFKCLNPITEGILCADDNLGFTADTESRYTESCSNAYKCEYTCAEDKPYNPDTKSCEKDNNIIPKCLTTVNGNPSINRKEILPLLGSIDKTNDGFPMEKYVDNGVDGNSCEGNDGKIVSGSMMCVFEIYNGSGHKAKGDPMYKIEVPCFGNDVDGKLLSDYKKQYFGTIETNGRYPTKMYALSGFGTTGFSLIGGDSSAVKAKHSEDKTLGEYKISLNVSEYLMCEGGKWTKKSVSDRICETNFALTEPYLVQKTPAGDLLSSSEVLKRFQFIDGKFFTSQYNGMGEVNADSLLKAVIEGMHGSAEKSESLKAMGAFIAKYAKLASAIKGNKFLTDGVSKVPSREMYFVGGDNAVIQPTDIKSPTTIIHNGKNITISGNITSNLMLLTTGTITFDSNDCNSQQVVQGVFFAEKGFKNAGLQRNTGLSNDKWCKGGNLKIQGVLMTDDYTNSIQELGNERRAEVNKWFNTNPDQKQIFLDRQSYIMEGASLLIEYSPSIFANATMAPGTKDFTNTLSVFRQ